MTAGLRTQFLYHFGRVHLPMLNVPLPAFENHVQRAFRLYQDKRNRTQDAPSWSDFLDHLHAVDWFLACACLENQPRAWDLLFAARAHRTDCLLVDALRARAVRLYPHDPEHQENAVDDFWGFLLAGDKPGATPILARYDGQRPLVPWLIRVFQNKNLSELRRRRGWHGLPEEDLEDLDLPYYEETDGRWHEEFRLAARSWLARLGDNDLLLIGLRFRYRLSQRQVAGILGIHEGNVSRHTSKLRDRCLDFVGKSLTAQGWTGENLQDFLLKEMDSLLMDEPRLAADQLAALLARRGKTLPDTRSQQVRE